MRKSNNIGALIAALCALLLVLVGCSQSLPSFKQLPESPFAQGETADLSGYASMSEYEGESRLVETDVKQAVDYLNSGESFILYTGFENCPYCNNLVPYLNEAAIFADTYIAYIDTRKDSSWQSNMDIDDYDLFVEHFGDWIDTDDDGTLHLYTPEVFYVKDGVVVAAHQGVIEGADDPDVPLTSEQEFELRKLFINDFNRLA